MANSISFCIKMSCSGIGKRSRFTLWLQRAGSIGLERWNPTLDAKVHGGILEHFLRMYTMVELVFKR